MTFVQSFIVHSTIVFFVHFMNRHLTVNGTECKFRILQNF